MKVVAINNGQSADIVLVKLGSERKMVRFKKEAKEDTKKETSRLDIELSQLKVFVLDFACSIHMYVPVSNCLTLRSPSTPSPLTCRHLHRCNRLPLPSSTPPNQMCCRHRNHHRHRHQRHHLQYVNIDTTVIANLYHHHHRHLECVVIATFSITTNAVTSTMSPSPPLQSPTVVTDNAVTSHMLPSLPSPLSPSPLI